MDSKLEFDKQICFMKNAKADLERDGTFERIKTRAEHNFFQEMVRNPIRRFLTKIEGPCLNLKHQHLGDKGASVLANMLKVNSSIERVELEENGIQGTGATSLADMLHENIHITHMVTHLDKRITHEPSLLRYNSLQTVSKNKIEHIGAFSFGSMLEVNNDLVHLNLSGTQLEDCDVEYIASGLEVNFKLQCLDLSKNRLAEAAGFLLGSALVHNTTLSSLDLSWNSLRRRGAVALAKSLNVNTGLKDLHLGWNGFGYEGSLALGSALRVNRTLEYLDVTNNRIDWNCIRFISYSLKVNSTLQRLEIGGNALLINGCLELLSAIATNRNSAIYHLGLDHIPINNRVDFMADSLKKTRHFTYKHGGVHNIEDSIGKRFVPRGSPLMLLTRFLHAKNIRVVDLFRSMDTNGQHTVSKNGFIRGLRKIHAPLEQCEMVIVSRKIANVDTGEIGYKDIVDGVKSQLMIVREEQSALMRQNKKKREKHRNIMTDELPDIVSVGSPSEVRSHVSLGNTRTNRSLTRLSGTVTRATPQRHVSDRPLSHFESWKTMGPLNNPLDIVQESSSDFQKTAVELYGNAD